jgi:hypothetical protein
MKGKTFREPLFHSVVSGQKTQFREIINPQPDENGLHDHTKYPMSSSTQYDMDGFWGTVAETGESKQFKPRYKLGETVYLKEPYIDFRAEGICNRPVTYKYDNPNLSGLRPFEYFFIPEKYARYQIEITGVKVERLQDISDEDCIKEGIVSRYFCDKKCKHFHGPDNPFCKGCNFYSADYVCPREAYAALIDEIHGKGKWQSNPFVWVYDFKLIR